MFTDYKKAIESLFKIEATKDYTLDNIMKATALLWNPQDSFKIIHVAGTNGKGSVSKMLFSVLKIAGKRVWVFTSPHLIDIKERFETESWNITETDFINILNKILSFKIDLSYFEKCVLIAFEFFKLRECEYVILEVWLGWLLDTTNIVNPIITTITSIWLDHQEVLWSTLEEIAFQKAWIIKPNIPLVLNFKNTVIEEVVKEKNAQIIFTDRKVETNLLWEWQEKNASLVYEIGIYLGIAENIILSWLKKVVHSGRLEFLKENILVDGAHNIDSLKVLKNFIKQNLEYKFDQIFYCFWLEKWKNIDMVLDVFWKNENYILVDIESNALEDIKKHSNRFPLRTKEHIISESNKNKKNLYVVFGSLYMIWDFLR